MPTTACENISCGSPPCQSNPVQPNERPSNLNQCQARVVSWDASLPPHSTSSRDLRRTIPLTGYLPRIGKSICDSWQVSCGLGTCKGTYRSAGRTSDCFDPPLGQLFPFLIPTVRYLTEYTLVLQFHSEKHGDLLLLLGRRTHQKGAGIL
jgi:hypothetical protein